MLEAVAILSRAIPMLKVFFAGSGSLERELRARCNTAGLTATVSFLGHRSDPEVLLAATDVAVMPSLYEGLPLAAIEAMASAGPVVATDIDGMREIVVDGQNGFLVGAGDAGALARAIERMVRFPVLARQLGMNGRRRAEHHFDLRSQVEETVSLYEELLSSRPRRGNAPGR
jgi:glycosyltransferase involved in cell wall biosynthesis